MIKISSKSILKWIYFCFVIFIPFSWAAFIAGSFYRSMTLLLLAVFLLAIQGEFRVQASNVKLLALWTVFYVYILLTVAWSKSFSSAVANMLGMGLVYLVAVIFATYDDSCSNQYLDWGWLLAGVLCVSVFLLGGQTDLGQYTSRVTLVLLGTETDPNEFAGTLLIPMSLSAYYIIRDKRTVARIIHMVLILVELYVILTTGSRGALIGALIAVVVTVCVYARLSGKSLLVFLVLAAVVSVVLEKLILPNIAIDILDRLTMDAVLGDGGSGRSMLWEDGIKQLWEGPLWRLIFGYGNNGIRVEGSSGATATMHNQFLQMIVNYGVIGLCLYLVLLLAVFLEIVKRNRKYVGAFFGMMALSMTLSLSAAYKPLWILLMMAFVGNEQNESEKDSKRIDS